MQVQIDPSLCKRCLNCVGACPAQAVLPGSNAKAPCAVDQERCWRCGLCLRNRFCPQGAFVSHSGDSSSQIQSFFSDPNTTHRLTGVPGRGTEECKTNDVTGRIGPGEVGLCIEFGRPGLGCTFADVGRLTGRLVAKNVRLERNNPLCALMDPETGAFPASLHNRRILSSILEVILPESDLDTVLEDLREVADDIETVFSVGLVTQFDPEGRLPILDRLQGLELTWRPNAKINLGLGRRSNPE